MAHPTFPASSYRGRMSTIHVRSTADLVRFGASLKIECGSGGAAKTLSGLDVARLCGADELRSICGRLKCERCGVKDARIAVPPPL